MPSNRITVNGSEDLSWDVPDSKMAAVFALLQSIGDPSLKYPESSEVRKRALEWAFEEMLRIDHEVWSLGRPLPT